MTSSHFASAKLSGLRVAAMLLVLTFTRPSGFVHAQPVTREITGANAGAGERATNIASHRFPPDVRVQLEKLATAMRAVHMEYRRSFAGKGQGKPTTFAVHFDGNHFYQRRSKVTIQFSALGREKHVETPHEDAFDGGIFYFGDRQPKGMTPPASLTKYLANDTKDPARAGPILGFPYLDAVGLYAPKTVAELMTFASVHSLVLHHLDESDSTQIETMGEHLRVSVRVPDAFLMAMRKTNHEGERRVLRAVANATPESIAKEIETLKQMQTLDPKRTVVFTLDPERGYAVAQREEFTATGQRILSSHSDRWKYYQNVDIWLPHRCIATYYLNPLSQMPLSSGQVNGETNELTLVEFGHEQNVSYQLDYNTPGTWVSDRTTAEARKSPTYGVGYVVSGDGTLLRATAENVLRGIGRGRVNFMIYVFVMLLTLPPIVFLIRRIRRSRKG